MQWLRTPDAHEMAHLDPEGRGERRVLVVWYMTVFPAVRMLAQRGCRKVFLFEDTCLFADGVDYRKVKQEVEGCGAGVFGYGGHEQKHQTFRWHGVKALFLTPAWCERQAIIFENLHVSRFRHVDIWLADRVARGEEEEFRILAPLAGYGHRMSQTQDQAGREFGGAWLPPPTHDPGQSVEEREAQALAMAPQKVRE